MRSTCSCCNLGLRRRVKQTPVHTLSALRMLSEPVFELNAMWCNVVFRCWKRSARRWSTTEPSFFWSRLDLCWLSDGDKKVLVSVCVA